MLTEHHSRGFFFAFFLGHFGAVSLVFFENNSILLEEFIEGNLCMLTVSMISATTETVMRIFCQHRYRINHFTQLGAANICDELTKMLIAERGLELLQYLIHGRDNLFFIQKGVEKFQSLFCYCSCWMMRKWSR